MKIRVKILIDKTLSPMLRDETSKYVEVDLSYTGECGKPWEADVVPEWATESEGDVDAIRYIQETSIECSVVEWTSDFDVVAQQHYPICPMGPRLHSHLIPYSTDSEGLAVQLAGRICDKMKGMHLWRGLHVFVEVLNDSGS
mmetsp:Transcript_4445/g.7659  ORF Transcript_4445/g.7659 Transcript_4445/m.7659 type:complete len:142 (-) Transcript_4445:1986-2411(-)